MMRPTEAIEIDTRGKRIWKERSAVEIIVHTPEDAEDFAGWFRSKAKDALDHELYDDALDYLKIADDILDAFDEAFSEDKEDDDEQ